MFVMNAREQVHFLTTTTTVLYVAARTARALHMSCTWYTLKTTYKVQKNDLLIGKTKILSEVNVTLMMTVRVACLTCLRRKLLHCTSTTVLLYYLLLQ